MPSSAQRALKGRTIDGLTGLPPCPFRKSSPGPAPWCPRSCPEHQVLPAVACCARCAAVVLSLTCSVRCAQRPCLRMGRSWAWTEYTTGSTSSRTPGWGCGPRLCILDPTVYGLLNGCSGWLQDAVGAAEPAAAAVDEAVNCVVQDAHAAAVHIVQADPQVLKHMQPVVCAVEAQLPPVLKHGRSAQRTRCV